MVHFVNDQNVIGFVYEQKSMRFTASNLEASDWLCLGCAVDHFPLLAWDFCPLQL